MADKDAALILIVQRNPGIWFREIMRQSGMKNGTLSHRLRRMEESGTIQVRRDSGYARYSSLTVGEGEFRVARALLTPTPRAILLGLHARDGLRFSQLVKVCRRSQSTVFTYLRGVVRDGLVTVRKRENVRRYYLNCKDDVERLVGSCNPPDRPGP